MQQQGAESQQQQPQAGQDAQHAPAQHTTPVQQDSAPTSLTDQQQAAQAVLGRNPLPAFAPQPQPLVILFAVLDGLMRVPRLAKTGE